MAQCTAPVYGHRTASGRANCPVCGYGGTRYSPRFETYHYGRYVTSTRSSGGSRVHKARWSPPGSTVMYSSSELRTLTPIRTAIERRADQQIDAKDVFLCHAWDDRRGIADELYDALFSRGVSVWFSEKNLMLGSSLMREIDKGLSNARMGIVLVTPSFINRVQSGGVADKELSALLARDLLVPIVHNTTFEALRETSPLLAARSGLSTAEDTLDMIAAKISELVRNIR